MIRQIANDVNKSLDPLFSETWRTIATSLAGHELQFKGFPRSEGHGACAMGTDIPP